MEVLDIEEACKFLKVAKPTLYNYVRAGKVPCFKLGRVWRFHKEALDTWVRNRVSEETEARSDSGKAIEKAALRKETKRAKNKK